jgi:hypothetical protein
MKRIQGISVKQIKRLLWRSSTATFQRRLLTAARKKTPALGRQKAAAMAQEIDAKRIAMTIIASNVVLELLSVRAVPSLRQGRVSLRTDPQAFVTIRQREYLARR